MTWFGYAIISSFLASLSTILEKQIMKKEHTVPFSAALSFCAALLSLPVFYFYRDTHMPLIALVGCYILSILATAAFIDVNRGVRHMEISNSAPLFLLSPLITALLAYIFLGESLSYIQISGIVLLGIGTYILQVDKLTDLKSFFSHLFGDMYTRLILIGLFIYAITSLMDRIILSRFHVPSALYVAYVQLFIAINFLFVMWKWHGGIPEIKQAFKDYSKGIVLVAVLTTGYRLAQAEATTLAFVGLVVAIKRSSSLFTTIIGGEIFHEEHLMKKSFACLIMVGGVFLIAFK